MRDAPVIDAEFLARIGCGEREKAWRKDILREAGGKA
jgi:hypothetical protein